ncbi:hypothetical protein ACFGVR_06840 [Mucilaginibacter sp. AW1-3]
MSDIFTRIVDNLIERTEGPMHFRFLIQPAVSLFFAIKAGLNDAKNNTVPYLWRFMFSKHQRIHVAKEGWKDVGKVFIMGTILDIIYQLIVIYGQKTQMKFYPLESFIVAFVLAIFPYGIFRGPVNRIFRMFIKKNKSGDI